MNGQFQLSRGRGTLAMNDGDDHDDETRGEVSFKRVRGLRKSFAFPRPLFFAKLASGIRNDRFSSSMSRLLFLLFFFLIVARNRSRVRDSRSSFEISAEFIGICCLKICNEKEETILRERRRRF